MRKKWVYEFYKFFAYAARSLNKILYICQIFASVYFILYNISKTVCMVNPIEGWNSSLHRIFIWMEYRSNMFKVSNILSIGIIKNDFIHDDGILREAQPVTVRANLLIRKFSLLSVMFCVAFLKLLLILYSALFCWRTFEDLP